MAPFSSQQPADLAAADQPPDKGGWSAPFLLLLHFTGSLSRLMGHGDGQRQSKGRLKRGNGGFFSSCLHPPRPAPPRSCQGHLPQGVARAGVGAVPQALCHLDRVQHPPPTTRAQSSRPRASCCPGLLAGLPTGLLAVFLGEGSGVQATVGGVASRGTAAAAALRGRTAAGAAAGRLGRATAFLGWNTTRTIQFSEGAPGLLYVSHGGEGAPPSPPAASSGAACRPSGPPPGPGGPRPPAV